MYELFAVARISTTPVEDLNLHLIIPVQRDLSADCASFDLCSPKTKLGPVPAGVDPIEIDQERPFVVGYDYVQSPVAVKVGKCYPPSIIEISGTYFLCNVSKSPSAIV